MPDPGEIDEAALDVGADELHRHAVADIEPLRPLIHLALDRWREDPHPGSLLGSAGHDPFEGLADPVLEQQGGGGLAHLALDLGGVVFLLDDATIDVITALGGLKAIAISHPHFYTTMVEWARVFNVPVHLHAANRQWVMRPDPAIRFWEGETQDLLPGIRLTRVGGHFAGSSVLTWDAGAAGRGALLSGDMPQVVSDRRYVSFMRSYPNLIPLPPAEVARIAGVLAGLRFDRIYAGFWDAHVREDAQAAVQRSAARYIAWSRGQDGRDSAR